MKDSHIQWTTHTFNPWVGCTKVSEGCAHCYAESLNKRWKGGVNWGNGAPRSRTTESNWRQPLVWNRAASVGLSPGQELASPRPRVFCASLADWLDDEIPIEWLGDLLHLVHSTPHLDWLLLTKRPENWGRRVEAVLKFIEGSTAFEEETLNTQPATRQRNFLADWLVLQKPPKNVWLGTTVESQKATARHIHLMAIPARVHFWSVEPMLTAVKTGLSWGLHGKPDWVICGGESGQQARAMELDWARELRFQCEDSKVAFFMKQLGGIRDKRGELEQMPEELRVRQFPEAKP